MVLPARVIDAGANNSGEVETGYYAALSHFWGGINLTTTSLSNFETHLKKIPLPLPRTFMDAVLARRVLSMRYLWIDSLCIVQDFPEDWALQVPQMAVIDSQSRLTLSADVAMNDTIRFVYGQTRTRHAARLIRFACLGSVSEA